MAAELLWSCVWGLRSVIFCSYDIHGYMSFYLFIYFCNWGRGGCSVYILHPEPVCQQHCRLKVIPVPWTPLTDSTCRGVKYNMTQCESLHSFYMTCLQLMFWLFPSLEKSNKICGVYGTITTRGEISKMCCRHILFLYFIVLLLVSFNT